MLINTKVSIKLNEKETKTVQDFTAMLCDLSESLYDDAHEELSRDTNDLWDRVVNFFMKWEN